MVAKRFSRRAVLAASAILPLVPTFARAQSDKPLSIGVVGPFSGPQARQVDEMTRGIELAVDEANFAGGILGRRIQVVKGDAVNPQQAISAVEKLATQDEVDLFVGTWASAISNTASDSAMRNNKVYWETLCLANDLTERGLPNFFRSGPNARIYGEAAVETIQGLAGRVLKKDVKDVKVWIEHEDSNYGTSVAQAQSAAFKKLGAQVVGIGAHPANAIDLSDAILRARGTNPDVWINNGVSSDSNLLMRAARDQGFVPAIMLFTGQADTPEILESLGAKYLDGILVLTYPRPDLSPTYGPGTEAFLAAYGKKYSGGNVTVQAMSAYVGVQILFEALRNAQSLEIDPVRAAVAALDKPEGSYCTGYGVKFDENMTNLRARPLVSQWQNGKVVTVFPDRAIRPGAGLINLPRRA
ncbi:ABC transporter substrate-binding protein [Sinorhizobium medicae]|uniref:ABC transporter substrate-binding protein n=1 Tax=Sinorhizobium medicae TaxID=110321 RepID=UPI000FDBECCB|nr:ABC transporter substrate-binding protein [Sinorhizobium medicae]RVO73528.1 ABC transporter substrate-binding protein [Sinorhizobium medicae]